MLKKDERVVWPFSCSRNAHDKKVLVRRAQSRIGQATLESKTGNWESARSWDYPSDPLVKAVRGRLPRPCLGKACPWAKRLSWQTQGGRVRSLNFLSILREC